MSSQSYPSTDAARSLFLPIAQSVRELADRLSLFCSESDQEQLSALSADLKGIGWNSLFVSSAIDRYIQLTGLEGNSLDKKSGKDISRQLSSLMVAADYFMRSIKTINALEAETSECSKDNQNTYACLAEKLGEIVRECKRSANSTNK